MRYPPFVLVGVRRQLRAHECKPSISCDLQHACASSFVRYRSLCIKEIDVTQKMRCIRAIDREILEFMQCPHAGHSRLHAQKTRACARWPEKPQIFARRGADKHRKGAPPWAESHRPPYETIRRSDEPETGRFGENTFFRVPEKGGLDDRPKKSPRAPRRTPQPGPGTGLSPRADPT